MAETAVAEPTRATATGPKIVFRAGSHITGVDPTSAAVELERIRSVHGSITPRATVDEAAHPDNPIHKAFEWDDAKAADEHRLAQARRLIRAVCIRTEPKAPLAPIYVHVRTQEQSTYEPVEVVVQSPGLLSAAVAELQGKLTAAQSSLNALLSAARAAGLVESASKAEVAGEHLEAATEAVRQVA